MNLEFHYYIVYVLGRKAGFPDADAHTIAYSSQFVDSSLYAYTIATDEGSYETIVTQNYGWWDDTFPRTVYLPYHFIPGDPAHPAAQRADGAVNPLNATPGSPNARTLLVSALQTRNLYRVGIGLHTYADTWAHQNFSGIMEPWNAVDSSLPIPTIGHAQVLRAPDDLGGTWEDTRLRSPHRRIVNADRHLKAARAVYKFLCTYNDRSYDDAELVIGELREILLGERRKGMEERVLDLTITYDLRSYDRLEWPREAIASRIPDTEVFTGYDKLLWLRDAALYRSSLLERKSLRAREGFASSNLYRWCEAARAHLAEAEKIIAPLLP